MRTKSSLLFVYVDFLLNLIAVLEGKSASIYMLAHFVLFTFVALAMLHSGTKTAFCSLSFRYCSLFRVQGSQLLSLYASRAYSPLTMRLVSGSGCSYSRYSTLPPDKQIEYDWVDGVERLEKYEPGGYHPAVIDDLLLGRYQIVDKLEFGGYSTIWLCRDVRLQRYVAIKVGISGSPLPRREPSILRDLSCSGSTSHTVHPAIEASDAIPNILAEFNVQGPSGSHPCYTVAPAQGNLREASFSRLFPIRVARALAAKLTMAVALVHARGFVHGG